MPPPRTDKQMLPYPTRTINAVINEAARLCIGGDSRGLTQFGEHRQQACCGRAAKENGLASAYIRCLFGRIRAEVSKYYFLFVQLMVTNWFI